MRRRRPASSSGSSATGRIPRPCLPVLSATSCSTHSPKLDDRVADDERQLVATRGAPARPARARATARGCSACARSARTPARRHRRARAARARVRRSAPPARARTATAPNSARRCWGRSRSSRGSRARAASSSSELPGSVIATKRLPSPHERVEVLEQRQRLDRAPGLGRDDEQRARRGRSAPARRGSRRGRSSRARAARARPEPRRRSARAPRARGSSRPCRAAPRRSARRRRRRARTRRARSTRSSIASEIVSQPSRSPISGTPGPPHSDSSLAHTRRATRCSTAVATRAAIAAESSGSIVAAIAGGRPVSDRLAGVLDPGEQLVHRRRRTLSMPSRSSVAVTSSMSMPAAASAASVRRSGRSCAVPGLDRGRARRPPAASSSASC